MINWAHFPRSSQPTSLALTVIDCFRSVSEQIDSESRTLKSNEVHAIVGPMLQEHGFTIELGKKKAERICVPVLYGNNGRISKAFDADAHHATHGFVIEIEAGRATINNQFLKDLFQACMMDRVKHLAIAVRNIYVAAGARHHDFDTVTRFFDTLYASNRLSLPLDGILIIGY